MTLYVIRSNSLDPYYNLASETQLVNYAMQNDCGFLFLWQNKNTVVIGKNQNPWKECNIEALEKDGATLARRTTGGGAVFHDVGNLNYSFVLPNREYDLHRQLKVVLQSCKAFGIDAQFSGRNDILANGAKFSGNAFLFNSRVSLQHGTLLVDADFSNLAKYLTPSKNKMKGKGIESVRSRVCNLCQLSKTITIEGLKNQLEKDFLSEYSEQSVITNKKLEDFFEENFQQQYEFQSSKQWNIGKTPEFNVCFEERFAWGEISVNMVVKNSVIKEIKVYTDSLLTEIPKLIENAVLNTTYNKQCAKLILDKALSETNHQLKDVARWLEEQI